MRDDKIVGFMIDGWYVFDNFSPFQIEWRGKLYPTSEHAYQAAHFSTTNQELAEQVRLCRSPKEAKDLANAHTDQDDPEWSNKKVAIMEEILRFKLDQHQHIQELLLTTGDNEIVETNDNDAFWGWGHDHEGQNHLGKIWMKLRAEKLTNS